LFSLRPLLVPQTVADSAHFVDRFGFHDPAHFLLYQSPVFLLDPVLYLDTLLFLRRRNHHLWVSFVANANLTDSFFQLYSTFVTALGVRTAYFWRHRVLITEVLCCLIQDVLPIHGAVASLASSFLGLAIPLLGCAVPNVETAVSLLRPIMWVIGIAAKVMLREPLQEKITLLLRTVDSFQPSLFYLTIRFVLSLKSRLANPSFIINLIVSHEFTSLDNLAILSIVVDHQSSIAVMAAVMRFAVTKKLWIRACFAVVHEIMLAYGNRRDVHDWVVTIVRRLFVFVALAHGKARYRRRSLLICEALVGLAQLHIPWLQQKIAAIAAAIATKPLPPYFRCFFPMCASLGDDLAIQEFDIFAGFQVSLKAFPFDFKRKVLLTPPVRDILLVTPKPMIKVTRSDLEVQRDARLMLKKKLPKGKRKVVNSALIHRPRNPVLSRPATRMSEQKLPGIGRAGI
jgi:hypothetical protein